MSDKTKIIPVVLFVYKRTDTLRVTLESLRRNKPVFLIVYSDAAKSPDDEQSVANVRRMVSEIDWCEKELHFSSENKGLGKSIKEGLSEVFSRFEAAIVCEDDLEFVEGTLEYMSRALEHYANDEKVMSVTGYTNSRITPDDVVDQPYFDGRFECWLWGTWRRVWDGMSKQTALEMMNQLKEQGENPYFWGGDLPYMAKTEIRSNIWAVRMCYLHILNKGLVVRPPWSMVNHIGWGDGATNGSAKEIWFNGRLLDAPKVPSVWPEAIINKKCAALHRESLPRPWSDIFPISVLVIRKLLKMVGVKI